MIIAFERLLICEIQRNDYNAIYYAIIVFDSHKIPKIREI